MNISLKASNMELTDAIRVYAEEKAASLEKFIHEDSAALVMEVGKSTHHHNKGPFMRCEMNLTLPGAMLRAEEEREDLYEAMDAVRDELKRQILDRKERQVDAHRGARPDKE